MLMASQAGTHSPARKLTLQLSRTHNLWAEAVVRVLIGQS